MADYYVAFISSRGPGCADIKFHGNLKNFESVMEMKKLIEAQMPHVGEITILNWKRYEKPLTISPN